MLSPERLLVARMVGGFFMLVEIVGVLYFPFKLASFLTVDAAAVVAAMSVFCFLPRGLLRWVRYLVYVLAFAAMCTTFANIYNEISSVYGVNPVALVLHAGLVGVLITMLMEARSPEGKQ